MDISVYEQVSKAFPIYLEPVLFDQMQSTKDTDPEDDVPVTSTAFPTQLTKIMLLITTLPELKLERMKRFISTRVTSIRCATAP